MVRYVSHRDAHFTSLAWGDKPALVWLRAVRNHTAAGATDTHLPVDRVGEEDLVFLRGVDLLGGGATGLRQGAGVVCDDGLQIWGKPSRRLSQRSRSVRPRSGSGPPTLHFHTLRYNLKAHHPVVVDVPLLQLLFMEVQDEGQVVVQVKLGEGKDKKQ